jgi:hypothetical protein
MEIVSYYITIQDNKECIEGVNCSSVDQSRYAHQLISLGTPTDDGKTE